MCSKNINFSMKKIICLLLVFFASVFCFSGCNKSLKAYSKNLTSYNIDAKLNYEEKTLTACQKVSYVNNSNQDLNFVCFNLFPTAFREGSKAKVISVLNEKKCYPNGKSYGNIEILECKQENDVAQHSLCGEDNNILKINLKQNLAPKKSVNLQIDFKVTIPNCNHRFGYNEKTINLGNWFPIACVFEDGKFYEALYSFNGDPFYSECANYNVSITAPKNLKVAGTGNKNTKTIQEATTSSFSALCVRDFALVIGEFEVASKKVSKIDVNYYYFNDENYKLSLETAQKALETFGKLFGKYPYGEFSVVQTKFVHGGMEFPGIVLISDEQLGEDYQNVIIHETAHEWWYAVVGNNQIENAWQDEALAEFSTALFYKKHADYNVDFNKCYLNLKNSYLLFEKVYGEVLKNLDVSMNRSLYQFNTEPEYTYLTYIKGNLMFKNLYDIMGEKDFCDALQDYYKTYKFKIASPQNLIECLSKHHTENLMPFFENWLSGNVVINEF